jgi:hypothetical protein
MIASRFGGVRGPHRRPGLRAAAAFLSIFAVALAPQKAVAESIVTEWLDEVLPLIDQTHPDPTTAARAFAVAYTAMYDAWAAYEPDARGVVTGDLLDGTGGPATQAAQERAMNFAMYNAMYALTRLQNPFLETMEELGLDPDSNSLPAILGKRVAATVLRERRKDGSNQAAFYDDSTNYMAADPSQLAAWQPDIIDEMLQDPTTPQWGRVLPFALPSGDALRPPPPPPVGTPAFERQIEDVLRISANLTDEQKAIAEYWIPYGRSPASHLIELTEEISERENLSLDEDIKLFFVVSNALFDAGVAAWDAKYHYDYVRPVTAIQRLGGQRVTAYDWRRDRTGQLEARDWEPYFETPPFPEYVSGHSAFTAAWARAMEITLGTDRFDYVAKVYKLEEEGRRFVFDPIETPLPTYWSAAVSSGESRLYGGVHWPIANTEGLKIGKRAGEMVFARAQDFFEGRAMPSAVAFAHPDSPLWKEMPSGGRKTPMLDPVPRGAYALTLEIDGTGADRAKVRVVVKDEEGNVLGAVDETGAAAPMPDFVTVNWASDGEAAFSVEIEPVRVADAGSYAVSEIVQVRTN